MNWKIFKHNSLSKLISLNIIIDKTIFLRGRPSKAVFKFKKINLNVFTEIMTQTKIIKADAIVRVSSSELSVLIALRDSLSFRAFRAQSRVGSQDSLWPSSFEPVMISH